MRINPPTTLALDLEGTLISNAMSQIPRPGLFEFLSSCHQLFPRVVIFTTVKEALFRSIACQLVEEGVAPEWFATIEYISWQGATKDLRCITGAQVDKVLLVDDYEPDQAVEKLSALLKRRQKLPQNPHLPLVNSGFCGFFPCFSFLVYAFQQPAMSILGKQRSGLGSSNSIFPMKTAIRGCWR